MDRIAFAVLQYLGLSETFIYEPLCNIKSFDTIVLTLVKENLDKFPYPHIVSASDFFSHNKNARQQTIDPQNIYLFGKIIEDLKIKLVHAHYAGEGIFMLPLKKRLNLPLITGLYGADITMFPRNKVYRHKLNQLFSSGDLFLAVSKSLKEKAISLGCPENKIIVHDVGIDINKFSPPKNPKKKDRVNILMCGRFVEKKGFAFGIKAFAQCLHKHRNIRLRIIGDGPLKIQLKNLIEKIGVGKFVTISGSKCHSKIAKAMQEADIFMMSYVTAKSGDSEGLPNVLKEAQAAGLPIISTFHAGVPEVVLNRETGLLAKEKDIAGLSKNLNSLIENPKLRIKFGKSGRRLIKKKFNVVNQTRKLEKIYRELISSQ
jgi:colanic acid/amylovoran biosynthesis glycosyltransferase